MRKDKKIEIEFLIAFTVSVVAGIIYGVKSTDLFNGVMGFALAFGLYIAVRPIVSYWYKRFMDWAGDIF